MLVVGFAWALIVVVPDLYRIGAPLATLDFQADNSGLVYQVGAPVVTASGTPASTLTLHPNDRIVLSPGACWNLRSERCRDYLAVFGGMGGLTYVLPGTVVTLTILPAGGTRPVDVTVVAKPHELDPATKIVLALCEIAAVIVLWLAFRLAWDSPGRMTIGFFLFALWFNPGQYFVLYALLQTRPVLLLLQESLQAIAQGAGYAGFLVFALRFPHDRRAHRLRHVEHLALYLGVVLAVLQLASFLNVFWLPTETITRCAILGGYAVAIAAFVVVAMRLRYQSALDYQRMRWVLWGCAIGLPAFIFADSNEATSLWTRFVWDRGVLAGWQPDEWVFELAFLVSGVLAIFICAAVRHRRIVSVTPELRALAATAVGLIVGVLVEQWLHDPVSAALTTLHVPGAAQFYLAVVPLVACSAAVHRGAHTVDHLFNHSFYAATAALDAAAAEAAAARDESAVDALLVHAPTRALDIASAAVFREANGAFSRVASSVEWESGVFDANTPGRQALVERLRNGELAGLPLLSAPAIDSCDDAATPALAVPVMFADQLYAVAIYGAHRSGAALDHLELDLLTKFTARAAVGYERIEMRRLRSHNAGQ